MLAETGTARSRNRHATAAASANQSVTLPVWIAEMTGGHSEQEPVATPVPDAEHGRDRERDEDQYRHDEEPRRLQRECGERNRREGRQRRVRVWPAPGGQRLDGSAVRVLAPENRLGRAVELAEIGCHLVALDRRREEHDDGQRGQHAEEHDRGEPGHPREIELPLLG